MRVWVRIEGGSRQLAPSIFAYTADISAEEFLFNFAGHTQ
jgi:hypothetical protein